MNTETTLWTIATVGILAMAAAVLKAIADWRSRPAFRPRALLTPNELEFLQRLESSVPELRFHAQVAMGALLDPAVSRSDTKRYFQARGMFSQKIVDFVAQSREDGAVVAVIELDDRTHDSERDARRDAMLESAGYTVVRWESRAKPRPAAIRDALLGPAARRHRPGGR